MPNEKLQPDLTPPWQSVAKGLAEGFIRKGEALQGAAMANMMTSRLTGQRPRGIEEAYAAGAEGMIERLREEWDQDLTRKFQAQYGEDMRRQSEELDKQHELALRVVDIPFTEEQVAQATDPDAAPIVPEKGYEVVNPVTGEVQHIKLGTPEARAHWKKVTADYYNGKNKLVLDYMDAAAQYPNSPGIQGLAEGMFNHMVQSVENEKNAQMAAVREQEMTESQQRMDIAERGIERQEVMDKARADVIREELGPEAEGKSDLELAAIADAREEELARQASEAQKRGILAGEEAEIMEGKRLAEEKLGITEPLSDQEYREIFKSENLKLQRQKAETEAAIKGREQLRPSVQLETLRDSVMISDEFNSSLQNTGTLLGNKRATQIQNEVERRLKLVPPGQRAVQRDRITAEVDSEIPLPDMAAVQQQLLSTFIEVQVRNSPTWQEEHVFGKGYDGIEDALGKVYPDLYPHYVKADPTRPLSATNNAAAQAIKGAEQARGDDPQATPTPASTEEQFPHFKENWAAPTPEQIQTAIKFVEESKVVEGARQEVRGGLVGPIKALKESPIEKAGLGIYKKHLQVLERGLLEKQKLLDQMALAQINPETMIAGGAYESQVEEVELVAERMQQAYDDLLEMLPKKERQERLRKEAAVKKEAAKRARAARDAIVKYYKEQGIDYETEEAKKYIEEVIKNPRLLREMGIM